jgi:hypothetical protein
VAFILVVVVSAVLYGFLDPNFGFDTYSLALVVGLVISLVVVSVVFEAPTLLVMRRRHHEWGQLNGLPAALPVAIVCVLISRIVKFQPGYLYGALAGIVFVAELSNIEEGSIVAIASVWALLLSLAAWLIRSPLHASAQAPNAAFGSRVADNALTAIFVAGLEGLVIGLLPMRFLDGPKLRTWNPRMWYTLFGLSLFLFVYVLLNPNTGYIGHGSGATVLSAAILFGLFGLASILFWAYFRAYDNRRQRRTPAPND